MTALVPVSATVAHETTPTPLPRVPPRLNLEHQPSRITELCRPCPVHVKQSKDVPRQAKSFEEREKCLLVDDRIALVESLNFLSELADKGFGVAL